MDAALRGRAATLQQQQMLALQNQQYQQQNHPHQHQQQQHYNNSSQQRSSRSQYSQSGRSIGSKSMESRDSKEVNNGRGGNGNGNVDEAYRRLGRRLSARAHGDGPIQKPLQSKNIGVLPSSMFTKYSYDAIMSSGHPGSISGGSQSTSMSSLTERTVTKIPKSRYTEDHDNHKVTPRTGNVLRKMTVNAADLFQVWQKITAASSSSSSRRSKKRSSPNPRSSNKSKNEKNSHHRSSPNRFAFSQLALDSSTTDTPSSSHHQQQQQPQQQYEADPHDQLPQNLMGTSMQESARGTLTAVMETSSQTSSQATTPNSTDANSTKGGSVKSRSSSTAASSSYGGKSSLSSLRTIAQGKCLTIPSEPDTPGGKDNKEGNLILHENDAISVSRKQIHVVSKDKMKGVTRADFRVQGLLGQGTFAQVFQCVHVQTGALVAVKIVKNKPAYTRQAAVEIDIFRALTQSKAEKGISSSQSHKVSRENSSSSGTEDSTGTKSNKWDHMVDMVCYFMHQNHLCLVFELLGLNLYEVLKKRQFRGLPLTVVRKIVRQAVAGVKEVSQRSIVHCDLKPENILLVAEDDADSVVSAGENRRLSASMRSGSIEKKTRNKISGSLDRKSSFGEPPMTASSLNKAMDGNPLGSAPLTVAAAMSESPTMSVSTAGTIGQSLGSQRIKLIDFGSACFEGQTAHTYIQSRFYRSPEVLVGLPYDSAIDMWSLGCVAAELFLGLPILPGVHEHDQLGRICEMITGPPDWMLDQGSKASKFFVKYVPRDALQAPTPTPSPLGTGDNDMARRHASPRPLPQWRLRTQKEYIASLSQNEIRKKGGLAKLQKVPANRYFRGKKLSDIISQKGHNGNAEDKKSLEVFVHFLYGILDPDPWKRWTAFQAAQHPFLSGGSLSRKDDRQSLVVSKNENQANILCDVYWEAPWDPSICRRKLLNVQKMREKQHVARRSFSGRVTPSRSPSTGTQDSATDHVRDSPHGVNNGLAAAMATQGNHEQAYRLSSSFTDYPQGPVSLAGGVADASSLASSQPRFATGPQSYSGAGFGNLPPGSYNEVDFAFALNRPGVVPMCDSVSSFDVGSVGSQQHLPRGSTGGSSRGSLRNNVSQRRQPTPMVSRSFGERITPSSERSVPMPQGGAPSSMTQQQSSASFGQVPGEHEGRVPASLGGQLPSAAPQQQLAPSISEQMPYHSESQTDAYSRPMAVVQDTSNAMSVQTYLSQSAGSFAQADVQARPMIVQGTGTPMSGAMSLQTDPGFIASDLQQQQQQLAYGNAQVYLQQQHAALQQQQLMLQQQQAALALQQQQLQAYGYNPALLNANMMPGGVPMNPNMAGLPNMQPMAPMPQANSGYYYVQGPDGTPIMMAAQPGMAQPGMAQPGMAQPGMAYGMPQGPDYGGMAGGFPGSQNFPSSPNGQYPQGM